MTGVINRIRKLVGLKEREQGATMVEYGLMVALIAVVCLAAVTLLGINIRTVFQNIAANI